MGPEAESKGGGGGGRAEGVPADAAAEVGGGVMAGEGREGVEALDELVEQRPARPQLPRVPLPENLQTPPRPAHASAESLFDRGSKSEGSARASWQHPARGESAAARPGRAGHRSAAGQRRGR